LDGGAFVFRDYTGALLWLGWLAALELPFCMLRHEVVMIMTTATHITR
jgi:hypothetical protein